MALFKKSDAAILKAKLEKKLKLEATLNDGPARRAKLKAELMAVQAEYETLCDEVNQLKRVLGM